MVKGIIVTHGNLAQELIQTAKLIYGEFSGCFAVSNEGKSPQTLLDEVGSLIDAQKGDPCLVFVDFFGGSCCHACMRLKIARNDVPIIAGINLPMLLAFLNKRDTVPFDRLPADILGRAHGSIQSVDPNRM